MPAEDKDAAQLLYEAALDYIDRCNQAEDELAALLHLTFTRPIPTLVTLGGVIDVTYLFDVPHDFEWKGLYIDADLRAIEIAGGAEASGEISAQKIFMQLSSLEGSVLESRVLEDNFQVEGISTAKLFGLANTDGIPILTIDAENIEDILPTLAVAENIKEDITHAVNQNSTVRIPQSEIAYEDWVGIGYLKENPQTGEAGWMLSGMVAGGMTVWGLDRWSDYYHTRLVNPYAQPSNEDPLSAQSIQKITKTDRQKGTAGEPLANPLQVIARDDQNRSVVDAPVTFTVKAGGGQFTNQQNTITVNTDFNGIAAAELILGRKTSDNPTMWWESGYPYSQQVGENIVDAALSSGTTITTPFVAYGMPGDPVGIIKLHGDNEHGDVFTWLGFIKVSVEDRYGNSIANVAVIFSMQPAIERSSCSNPNQDSRPGLVISQDDACINSFPEYGQCAGAKTSQEVITDFKGALVYVMNSFSMSYTFASDSYGNNINAAQPGAGIPLTAKMSYLREGEDQIDVTFDCEGEPLTCPQIIGSRQYYRDTAFTSAAMSFGGVEGTAEADGVFSAQYEVKPGINDIPITGTATIGYRKSIVNCSGCSIVDHSLTQSGSVSMRVYGVEIQTEPQFFVPVNETGDVTEDYTLSYTIAPSEYKAGSAYIIIFKNDEPMAYIPAETQGIGTGIISRGTGFDLDAEIRYDVQIVLNMGSGVEIKTAKIPLYLAPITIAKEDPEFLHVQLRWNDYYPPLGDKTVVIKADGIEEGSFGGRKIMAEITYPDTGATITPIEPTYENGKFADGKVAFWLSGQGLAPSVNNDPSTGTDKINIKFTLLSENGELEGVIYGSWNVKNNSNTVLAEVLAGEAVFVVDVDSNGNVITAENHKGQTIGNTDDKREVDYVLKMINHIIPPLRTPVVKSNQQNTLPNNGLYGGMTEKTVKALTEGGGPHAISLGVGPQQHVEKTIKDS